MVYRSCYCSCNVLIQQWIRQMTYGSSHHCCSHKISEKSIQQILCYTVGLIHSKSDKYSKAKKSQKGQIFRVDFIFLAQNMPFQGYIEVVLLSQFEIFFPTQYWMPLLRDVTWSTEFMGQYSVSGKYMQRARNIHCSLRRLWKVVSSSKYNWLRLTGGYFCVSKPTNKVESFYFHGNVFGLSMNERRRNPRMSESSREQYSKSREAIINLRILFSFP